MGRETATHGQGQSAEVILLDIFKNKRDISIFRVVFELEKIYGKDIIVIFQIVHQCHLYQ